jgi:hypothetical protein
MLCLWPRAAKFQQAGKEIGGAGGECVIVQLGDQAAKLSTAMTSASIAGSNCRWTSAV